MRIILWILIAAPAWCWGPAGHHVVAMIAEQRLSPEARATVNHLLFDGKYTMAQTSTCPDALRSAERGSLRPEDQYCLEIAGQVPKGSGPWHYIDIPFSVQSGSLDSYCPEGACVTVKIAEFAKVLHESTDDAERRAALMYLIHFVGDIFQPLHDVERGCDQGGNQEHVNFYLKHQERADHRLHAVWDSDLVDKAMADSRIVDHKAYADALLAGINGKNASKWEQESIPHVAWDSHALAVRHAYRGIPSQDFCAVREAMARDPGLKPPPPRITDLRPDYEKAGARIVREQLMKAGVKLAQMIE